MYFSRRYRPETSLGRIRLTRKSYFQTVELAGIRIFHYSGSLNFACRQHFRDEVYKVAGQAPKKEANEDFKHGELKEAKKVRRIVHATSNTNTTIMQNHIPVKLLDSLCCLTAFFFFILNKKRKDSIQSQRNHKTIDPLSKKINFLVVYS